MKNQFYYSFAILTTLVLTACSGSSGSSGGANVTKLTDSTPAVLTTPVTATYNSKPVQFKYAMAVDLNNGQRFLGHTFSSSETMLGLVFTTYPINCSSDLREDSMGVAFTFVVDREDGLAWQVMWDYQDGITGGTGSTSGGMTKANIYWVDEDKIEGELTFERMDSSGNVIQSALGDFVIKNCSSLKY